MSQEKLLTYRFGFVMEQNLGHRTHYRNLLRYVREDQTVSPTWMPIEFDSPRLLMRLPVISSNWSARSSLIAWNAVRRAHQAQQLAAVFYHTQVTSLLAPLHRGLPSIISLDATPINYDSVGTYYGHSSGGRMERYKYELNRRAFEHAVALVTWCRWAKDSLIHDYGIAEEKITVIAPGVDLAQWPGHWARERARDAETRKPHLLFVGGDFERKGGDVLLECFHRYLQDTCELSIVTQSPVAPERNLHIYHNVAPNSDTLLRLYAQADIFVFPTLADCAPLAVPEAMAAALPVVSTRIGAIPEMVRDGEQGLLVERGSADELYAALKQLMDSPELRMRMGNRGRETVLEEYDAGRNAQQLLDLLKNVTNRAHQLPQPAQTELVAARR
ncbi:MAG: glycosyltransferase family 4 protein [Ktedonobacterales bacterium]